MSCWAGRRFCLTLRLGARSSCLGRIRGLNGIADKGSGGHDATMVRRARRIAMVGFADAQMLDICGPLEVFSRASRVITDEGRQGPDVYAVELLAHRAGAVRTFRASSSSQPARSRAFETVWTR